MRATTQIDNETGNFPLEHKSSIPSPDLMELVVSAHPEFLTGCDAWGRPQARSGVSIICPARNTRCHPSEYHSVRDLVVDDATPTYLSLNSLEDLVLTGWNSRVTKDSSAVASARVHFYGKLRVDEKFAHRNPRSVFGFGNFSEVMQSGLHYCEHLPRRVSQFLPSVT